MTARKRKACLKFKNSRPKPRAGQWQAEKLHTPRCCMKDEPPPEPSMKGFIAACPNCKHPIKRAAEDR